MVYEGLTRVRASIKYTKIIVSSSIDLFQDNDDDDSEYDDIDAEMEAIDDSDDDDDMKEGSEQEEYENVGI